MERGESVGFSGVDVGVLGEKRLDGFGIAILDGVYQTEVGGVQARERKGQQNQWAHDSSVI